jgi:hypothetical protein
VNLFFKKTITYVLPLLLLSIFVFSPFFTFKALAQNTDPIKKEGFQIVPKCKGYPTVKTVVGPDGTKSEVSSAQPIGTNPDGSPQYECGWYDLIELGRRVMLFLLYISLSLAVFSMTYAGFLYVTSFGDMGKVEKAHSIFTTVVTGLLFVFGGWLIIATILKTLGVENAFSFLDLGGVSELKDPRVK